MSTGKNKNKNRKRGNDRSVKSNKTEKTKDGNVETRWSLIVKRLLFIFKWIPFFKQKGDDARSNNENKTIASSSKHQNVDDQAQSKKKNTDLLKQEDRQNENETIIAQLTKRNTDLETQLKHHEEKYKQRKTKQEKLKDNLKDKERKLNDTIKEQRDKIDILEKECTECTGTNAGVIELNYKIRKDFKRKEDTYREMISKKDEQIKHLEDETREMKVSFTERGTTINKRNETINKLKEQNIKVEQESAHFKKRISKMETEMQHYKKEVSEKRTQIDSLMAQNKALEEEKQDALRRLSAMMSVKLRDNNPNIADLSDQFRPTKLGEQFSELYDNEWTDAFDALQSSFGERHAISFLLDIVMESYEFCDQKLSEEWMFAKSWFIVEAAQTAQQTLKYLKDGRKQKIIERVSDIEQKYAAYLLEICSNTTLTGLVKSGAVRNYISTCIKLTLLMTANDPPVVIECPGWQRCSERPSQEDAWSHKVSDASSEDHIEHCEPADSIMVTESSTFEKPNTKQLDNEIHPNKDKHESDNDNTHDEIMNVSLPQRNGLNEDMHTHDFVSHSSTTLEESKTNPADMTVEGHSATDSDMYKHVFSKTREMPANITDVVSVEAYMYVNSDKSVKEGQQADSREKELSYQNTHTKQHDNKMHANKDYQLCEKSNDAVDEVINEPTPSRSGVEDDFHNHD